ncbi:MAG: chemotaxis protein CheW [Bdellovibrionales bacterium]|nr:chemotaxis protein CheW [Bdellovibrionales bacterium]
MTPVNKKHFVFEYQSERFAVPVEAVLELTQVESFTPYHLETPALRGTFAHRGVLIPIVDPYVLTASNKREAVAPRAALIVHFSDLTIGFTIDQFDTVLDLNSATHHRDEESGEARLEEQRSPYISEVRGFRDTPLIVLDLQRIASLLKRHIQDQVLEQKEVRSRDLVQAFEGTGRSLYLSFELEHLRLAAPVSSVIEAIEGYDVTPLYKVPPALRGLLNLRGTVIACVDISTGLELSPRPLEENSQFLILRHRGSDIALCVDRISSIQTIDQEEIFEANSVVSSEMGKFIEGVVEQGQPSTLFLLSTSGVFSLAELQPFRREGGHEALS